MSKTITESGKLLHRGNCDCDVCQELRDGNSCGQCGGDVVIVEGELAYRVTCELCRASATVLKAELN